jgi:hypothetical protein
MRMLLGMIFGAVLLTGVVFVADHWNSESPSTTGSASSAIPERPMVNWDVVGDKLRVLRDQTASGVARLSHKIAG